MQLDKQIELDLCPPGHQGAQLQADEYKGLRLGARLCHQSLQVVSHSLHRKLLTPVAALGRGLLICA